MSSRLAGATNSRPRGRLMQPTTVSQPWKLSRQELLARAAKILKKSVSAKQGLDTKSTTAQPRLEKIQTEQPSASQRGSAQPSAGQRGLAQPSAVSPDDAR